MTAAGVSQRPANGSFRAASRGAWRRARNAQPDQRQRDRQPDRAAVIELAGDMDREDRQQENAEPGRPRPTDPLQEPGEGDARQGHAGEEVAHVPVVVHQERNSRKKTAGRASTSASVQRRRQSASRGASREAGSRV